MLTKNSVLDKICSYVYLFFVFAFTGWVYEVVLAFIYGHGFINRGFLFGPYLPIYGFGGIILLLILKKLMGKRITIGRLNVTPFIVFILIMIISTAIEFLAGSALEAIFNKRWWDYSHYPYNFKGLVCLSATVRFGIGGMFFLYLLTPLLEKLYSKIPAAVRIICILIIAALVIVDLVVTL